MVWKRSTLAEPFWATRHSACSKMSANDAMPPETGAIQTAHEFAMSFFGYLKRKVCGSRSDVSKIQAPQHRSRSKSRAAEDAESFARGEVPEARLIPHHAIKRDVIGAAYTKDFDTALRQVSPMGWTETEKKRQIAQMNADFEKHIYGLRRLGWPDLDKILALMKDNAHGPTRDRARCPSQESSI